MQKIFISSKLDEISDINLAWYKIREEVKRKISQFGHKPKMFEHETPQPDSSVVTYIRSAEEATCFIGIFGNNYSRGTINEYYLFKDKPWYIFLLKLSAENKEEIFAKNCPNNWNSLHKIKYLQNNVFSARSVKTIYNKKQLFEAIEKTIIEITAQEKWKLLPAYDPRIFVGRTKEIEIAESIIFSDNDTPKCLIIKGVSHSGKTALLRNIGYLLEKQKKGKLNIEFISPDLSVEKAFMRMIGSLISYDNYVLARFLTIKRIEEIKSIVGGANLGKFLQYSMGKVLVEMKKQKYARKRIVWIIDNLQDFDSILLEYFLINVLREKGTKLRLIVSNRTEGSAQNIKLLEKATAGWSKEDYCSINLAEFNDKATSLRCIYGHAEIEIPIEKEYLYENIPDNLAKVLPGDLAEIGQIVKDKKISLNNTEAINNVIHEFQMLGSPNITRWKRYEKWQDDCRIISPFGIRAPVDLLVEIYKRKYEKIFRNEEMERIGLLRSWYDEGKKYCAIYPERFSEFIVREYLEQDYLDALARCTIDIILEKISSESDLYWIGTGISLLKFLKREKDIISGSIQLGKYALNRGALLTGERALKYLAKSAFKINKMSNSKIDLLLEYSDVLRQIGKREEAIKMVRRLVELKGASQKTRARAISILLRLERDINGANSAHQLWKEISKVRPAIKMTSKLLDQLARIARDRGQLRCALAYAVRAENKVRSERGGFRRYRTIAEIQYTLGSIARALDNRELAIEKLNSSVEIRQRTSDIQGISYALNELAFIMILQKKYIEAEKLLENAKTIATEKEIMDK
jgi:hypothetical protein